MFARKNESLGKELPQILTEGLSESIKDNYQASLKRENLEVFVFGQCFEDELLIIVSLVPINISLSPYTLSLSLDLDNQANMTKKIDWITGPIGLFLDDFFTQSSFSDYHDSWLESAIKDEAFFYKINRENIFLTLEANKLLEEK